MSGRSIPALDETSGGKLARKAKDSPFMVVGKLVSP